MNSKKYNTPAGINNVIFFDGLCNLCNWSVDFVIRRDKNSIFRYTSLQSEFARAFLDDKEIPESGNLSTIYLFSDGQLLSKSSAIFMILKRLPSPWKYFGMAGAYIPWFISDFFYNFISRNRYKWLGKRSDCRVPTEKEKSMFIQ